eukprot:6486867-Prymnesium_polylepis.1
MEDRAAAWQLTDEWLYAGVYDGHVGAGAAAYAAENMHRVLAAKLAPADAPTPEAALVAAFEEENASFLSDAPEDDSGTTACVLLRRRLPDGGGVVVFASAGDSRAVLQTGDFSTVALTRDFKPDDEDEYERIEAAGGSVFDMEDGCGGRVVAPDNVSMLQV